MEIYVDVKVHKWGAEVICDRCRFLFNSFSHNYDVYQCSEGDAGDLILVIAMANHRSSHLTLGQSAFYQFSDQDDPEHFREIVIYAAEHGYIPEKFAKWARDQETESVWKSM